METDEEKEKWVIEHIRPEFRNGYREQLGIPLKDNEDENLLKVERK